MAAGRAPLEDRIIGLRTKESNRHSRPRPSLRRVGAASVCDDAVNTSITA